MQKRNEIIFIIFSCLALSLFVSQLVCSADSSLKAIEEDVLAMVGNVKITSRDLENRIKNFPKGVKEVFRTKEGKENLLRDLVRIEVFAREARAIDLDKSRSFQKIRAEVIKALLAEEYTNQQIISKITVSEKEIRQYYENHLSEFTISEKIKASVVFIKIPENTTPTLRQEKKEIAKNIRKQLESGDDVSKAVERFSQQSSGIEYNENESIPRGRLVPEIENDVFKLEVGEISPILTIKEGFLLFKVGEKIPEELLSREEVSNEIGRKLEMEKRSRELESIEKRLFAKYKVEFVTKNTGSDLKIHTEQENKKK